MGNKQIANHMIAQIKEDPDLKPCIIFISSISAIASSPLRAEYCISKAGLSQASRLFADRLADYGIRV